MHSYIQDDYYILGNTVSSAIDGITGMPVISTSPISPLELRKAVPTLY